MYDLIFATTLETTAAAVAMSLAASLVVGRMSLWWRSLLFSFIPAAAAGFYLSAIVFATDVSRADLWSGLLFESVIVLLHTALLARVLKALPRVEPEAASRLLRWSLVIQLLVAWPLVTAEGFGIFSQGSRIEYLEGSAWSKYLTYALVLLAPLQAALLAHRVSRQGGVGTLGAAVVVAAFVLSLASGSKGAFFLWVASIAALVDYRRARIKRGWLVLAGSVLLGALWYTAVTVATFLDIPTSDFLQLALGRFFLSNDARALAFDVRWQDSGSGDVLRESFRSLSGLFGNAPRDPPLGLLLYSEYLGTEGLLGANASLMALITYYFPPGYALLPALLAAGGAALLYGTIRSVGTIARTGWVRSAIAVWGLLLVQQLSQDFLAFQLVLPMFAIGVAALLMLERIGSRRSRQALPDISPVSPSLATHAHHRHSGT